MNAHTLQAAQIVDRIVANWRVAPTVKVVHATADLPVLVPSDTRGLWRGGEAFIVSSQPLDMVGDTLAHEVIAHHGLRETLGQSWRSFMLGVQSGLRAGDGRLRCFRDEVRSVYVDANGVFNLSATQESDEIAAAITESRFNGATGKIRIQQPMRMLMRAAAGHISREVLYRDKPVDFDQLLGTILITEHRLRHGGLFFGLGYRLRRWYAPPMPSPKPVDRYTPPMTLAESEELLRADDNARNQRGEWRFLLMALTLFASILVMFVSMGAVVWGVFDIFAGLIR